MGLTEYRKKRDFKITREPAGNQAAIRERRIFVVQHHFASSEHYDFRLELDGVLKSWAVPKGPSIKPGERRLAVEVEDHPLEYATFTGRIPEGQYGAGKVERWDMGTWETETDAAKALKRGSLEFVLKGKRLKGGWRLIRMKDDDGNAKKHIWLLMKRSDKPVKTPAHAATKKG